MGASRLPLDEDRDFTRSGAVRVLKPLQLAVSVGLLLLFWQIYSDVLLAMLGIVGLCYVAASFEAIRDKLGGIWLAFTFSALTLAFGAWGVYRYLDNGFDFLSGNFAGRAGIHWPAYLFLLVALGALAVVLLHIPSWRWMLRPER